jgi:hypothetical protein
MSRIHSRWAVSAAAVFSLMLLLAAMPADPGLVKVSGKLTMKYSQQHPLPAGDAAGPVLLANEAKGTNISTGSTEYMDGAQVISIEIADLTQGIGQHQGYITFRKGGDTGLNRWNGRVTTTMTADNKPVTTFEGTWTKIKGTGRYQGATGKGRYKGSMITPNEYVVEWEGELNLKDGTASR